MNTHIVSELAWERMVTAVEKVRQRLRRATQALAQAGIPYAVIGGNAVAAWVSEVDEAAVRNTPDVDVLLRRSDLEQAKVAMASAGFLYRRAAGIDMFLDGPDAKDRDAVHVCFAGERIGEDDLSPMPHVDDSKPTAGFQVVSLEALVQMKLISYRCKDRVHILDLIDVGLVDVSWLDRLPPPLAARLKELLDTPNG